MAAMDTFYHILNWKLKRGSHAFPGKDGGTCIDSYCNRVVTNQHRAHQNPTVPPRCPAEPDPTGSAAHCSNQDDCPLPCPIQSSLEGANASYDQVSKLIVI
jgi:hypothetical protein